MKSTVVIATICAMFITFGDAEPKITNLNIPGASIIFGLFLDDPIEVCGFSKEMSNYTVEGVSSDSPKIGGCAYVDYKNTSGEVKRSFNVWLSNLQKNGQQCGEEGMEQIIFTCMGIPTEIESDNYGTQYVRLFGQVANNNGLGSARCALLEKERDGNKKYRLVVSGDNLCTGLSKYFTDEYPKIKEGSKLLRFIESSKDPHRFRRSTSNSTSSMKNENWYYMWMLG